MYLQGYVLVENFFTTEELEPARQACSKLVDIVAQRLFKAGKISSRNITLSYLNIKSYLCM